MILVGKAGRAGSSSCRGGDVIIKDRDVIKSCDDVTRSDWAGIRGRDRSFKLILSSDDLRRVEEEAFSAENVM